MNRKSIAIVAGLLMAGSLNSLAIGNNNIKCQPLLSFFCHVSMATDIDREYANSLTYASGLAGETVRNLQKIFKVDNNSPFTECVLY
ncbi:hypothetical protein [Segatella copri]|uniref:hypothetical protein n=1 Tax=Segatella copri TaxID=165179 RepID=UPI0022E0F24F|nr:hypothetical protein [Segatella copri]